MTGLEPPFASGLAVGSRAATPAGLSATATTSTTLAAMQRQAVIERLPFFVLGWLAATILFVAVLIVENPSVWKAGVTLCLVQVALVAGGWSRVRARSSSAAVQWLVLGICAGLGLSSMAFYIHLGGREPIVAMMLFALGFVSSLLFVWRWYAALILFGLTYVPWMITAPWDALQLTPLQGLAGAAIGAMLFALMAEGSFRSFRAAFLHRESELERTRELQASRDAYRDLAENATDLIWTADLDWRFTYVNEATARHVGQTAAEILGLPLRAVLTDHPANDNLESVWSNLAAGESPEPRIVQVRPGPMHSEPRWFDVVASPLRDERGRVAGIRGISRDVTERRRAEEALRASREKLRHLAHGQVRIREEERKRLGLDLHDDVCQELVGIGILVESVRVRLGGNAPGNADLSRVVRYLSELVEHLRELAGDLRPLQLSDLGLAGILGSLVAGMTSADMQVMLDVPATLPRLDEEAEIAVYRIAQEALRNAARHSGARRVHVVLATGDGRLRLEIRDDGRGFDRGSARPNALGLVSMEERALAVHGTLDVESRPGDGTTIRLDCPLVLAKRVSAA